jgi:hypothetical protein
MQQPLRHKPTGKVYQSYMEAARSHGLNRSNLRRAVNKLGSDWEILDKQLTLI